MYLLLPRRIHKENIYVGKFQHFQHQWPTIYEADGKKS